MGAETPHTQRGPGTAKKSPRRAVVRVRLIPTGETEDAEIFFEWSLAGRVEKGSGDRLSFPRPPSSPGIYRFSLFGAGDQPDAVYIGESGNLDRRMKGYQNPGPTRATNQRLNGRLTEHLVCGGQVEVAVAVEVRLDGDPLDLAAKVSHILGESLALVQATRSGAIVENL